MQRIVPVELLREHFDYCPVTGRVTHRIGTRRSPIGFEAGYVRKDDGYRVVKVLFEGRRVQIMVHVVAWAIHYGEYPNGEVDHENTVRTDNWIANLREATRSQNNANKNKVGTLPKGVTFDRKHKTKPYKAQLKTEGKNRYLGNYADPVQAHQTYMTEAGKVFGEFARA